MIVQWTRPTMNQSQYSWFVNLTYHGELWLVCWYGNQRFTTIGTYEPKFIPPSRKYCTSFKKSSTSSFPPIKMLLEAITIFDCLQRFRRGLFEKKISLFLGIFNALKIDVIPEFYFYSDSNCHFTIWFISNTYLAFVLQYICDLFTSMTCMLCTTVYLGNSSPRIKAPLIFWVCLVSAILMYSICMILYVHMF